MTQTFFEAVDRIKLLSIWAALGAEQRRQIIGVLAQLAYKQVLADRQGSLKEVVDELMVRSDQNPA
jgi:hypothetical protein